VPLILLRKRRGKRSDRPGLAKAIAACKKHRAKLVIAKLAYVAGRMVQRLK
jgi:hypothetical protein